ncbi:TonB-dependent receptor [Litorivivens sp.]|uniref:TonB-dependent receptor n=1 Tax=Litorivivens sp. TaxID=2020868 RepID=UPI003569C286
MNKLLVPLLAALLPTLFLPLKARAQLEEVVVTAQKREQNLQDVPMAVSAVGRERIEASEINNIEDLAKIVPSLRFTADAYINSSVNIRGVGTNVYSVAVEPNVSVMLDGVPLARNSQMNFDFADIERVEVLRGPQGTLFGKNASAGLVHVITRDPAQEFEARLRFNIEHPDDFPGSFTKLQGTASGPLTDTLGLRITAFASQRDGHLEDVSRADHVPKSEQLGVRGKLRWNASDTLSLRLNLEAQRRDGTGEVLTYRSGNPSLRERSRPIQFSDENRQGRSAGDNVSDADGKAASLAVDWDLESMVLSSVTGFRRSINDDNITAAALDGARVDLSNNYSEIEIETFTQELRLTSANNPVFEYTAGMLWFDNRVTEDYDRAIEDLSAAVIAGTVAPGLVPIGIGDGLGGNDAVSQYDTRDAEVDISNLGVFAEGTWHFDDRWHLTVGARFIDEEVSVLLERTSRLAHATTNATATSSEFAATRATVTDETVTGKLALMLDWNENVNLYAAISTGYRGATFDVAGEDPAQALANPVDPEKARSYEVGVKSRLFNNRLELNATAFLTYFEDFQAQIRDLENTGSIVSHRLDNAGELETRGVEIEFHARPIPELSVVGSVLFNRAIYNDFITQCFPGQGPNEGGAIDSDGDGSCDAQDVSGGVLANAPKRSASLTTRYDHLFDSGSALYGQVTGRWQDDVQFTNEQQPTTVLGAYSVWDMRLGWTGAGARYEIAGYVNNLFAQRYVRNLIPLTLSGDRRDIVHNMSMGADRIFGVSLGYRW